jgi:hypothetical protein
MSLKIGSLVFATEQGLGVLARQFYDAGILTSVMIVRHGRRETHLDWYPASTGVIGDLRSGVSLDRMREYCRQQDVMLFFETPFEWSLITYCREHGVKVVLMPMYECMPEVLPQFPDVFFCPSLLDFQYYQDHTSRQPDSIEPFRRYYADKGGAAYFTPIPVPGGLEKIDWKQRKTAEVFVHNAGHGGLRGRNGTRELLDALQYVTVPARVILRSQEELFRSKQEAAGYLSSWRRGAAEVSVRVGTVPYAELYADGDVFVFPEKFNGLSLPLQEARAAGMLIMCGNRFPMNTWLPKEPLIPVAGYRKARVAGRCLEFEEALFEPRQIAQTINEWYGKDISEYSLSGKQWAEENSWEVLGPKYRTLLEGLCYGS